MKAHRTDIVSFAFGLIFLGLAAWWLLAQLLGLALPPVGWFLAGALILIGLLGLVGALRSGRSTDVAPPADAGPTDADPTDDSNAPAPGGPAPGGSGTGPRAGDGADEWPTEAVTDVRPEAVEDRPADGDDALPGRAEAPPAGEERPR